MPKTPKYQKKASADYKERMEADGYKRVSISFWVKKIEERAFKSEILKLIESLKGGKK